MTTRIEGYANPDGSGEGNWSTASDESRPGFCPDCGYSWKIHSNAEVSWSRPFGCPPSEHAAQERWGR